MWSHYKCADIYSIIYRGKPNSIPLVAKPTHPWGMVGAFAL